MKHPGNRKRRIKANNWIHNQINRFRNCAKARHNDKNKAGGNSQASDESIAVQLKLINFIQKLAIREVVNQVQSVQTCKRNMLLASYNGK